MRQETVAPRRADARPPYAPLIQQLRRSVDDLVDEVVRDVALPAEDPAAVAIAVRPAVDWTLDALVESEQVAPARLAILRDEGRRAATNGDSLQRLLDRYLSTGWVVWGAATRQVAADRHEATPADAESLATLGTALLKSGDAAAAAIAGAYGETERALALRVAGARREFIDALLDLTPADAEAAARMRRRAVDFGLDAAAAYRLVVVAFDREIEDGAAELDALADALARAERTPPRRATAAAREPTAAQAIVASRRGRAVVLLPTADVPAVLRDAVDRIAPDGWLGVATAAVAGLTHLAETYAGAIDAIAVATRLGRRGLMDADEVLLERSLLADEALLTAAVDRELAPVLRAPRNGRLLVDTVAAYLEQGQNVRATARALGIAPRTVAYRLRRAETLLGGPIRGERAVRLATSLFARNLLRGERTQTPPIPRAGSPRPAPRGRSRSRPSRARAT